MLARAAVVVLGLTISTGTGARAETPPCPASFAKASGACDVAVSPPSRSCVFPEGKCTCLASVPCSGVPRPPGEPRWKCRAARTDGCPDDAPAPGGACAKPGKTCSYGECGSLAYTCDAGRRTWFISGVVAPPPSAPGGGARPAPTTVVPTTTMQTSASSVPAPTSTTKKAPPTWKQCPKALPFGCETRSQGVAPARGETIPKVCGCVPRCPPSSRVLISREAGGKWPDGSLKGRFTCATGGIPSAPPRNGL